MYVLDRERAMPIIWPGLIRDAASQYSNDLHAKGVKWEDYPQWLKDYWPNIRKHDMYVNGANFEVIDA